MSYQVIARKWRPMIFDDVIGQKHVTNTLKNAIASNRVAHAYIFSGTRGCGKTTTARILARALNCLSPVNQNPDNTCEICKEIIEGRSLDVIEIDGASNRGIEEVRNLRDSVRYVPTRGKYKVYIIDEVHMLTKEAFNALLKTLEEPPAHIVFVFATTEVHKVPMTILSRCQRFDFLRISVDDIVASLSAIAKEENVNIENEALTIIAKRADGSLRDAQSIFDQVCSFCGNDIKAEELLKAFNVVDQEVYFKVTDLFKSHDTNKAVVLIDEIIKSGYDLREFVAGLVEHLRNLLIVRAVGSSKYIETSDQYKKRYEEEAGNFNEQDLLRYIKQANELDQALRWASQPRYRLEAGLIQMVKMESVVQITELLQQIEELKKKINEGQKINSTSSQINPVKNVSQTNELKVIGEVGAGYLKSKSAVNYSSLIGTDLTKLSGLPKTLESKPSITESPSTQFVTMDEVSQKWTDFVSGISKSHIAVGATLTHAQLIDVNNGTVRVACPDDFHFSTLKRNKDLLSNTLCEFVGKKVNFEPVLSSNPNISVKPVFTTISKSNNQSSQNEQNNEHPILTILKRELGAEPIG